MVPHVDSAHASEPDEAGGRPRLQSQAGAAPPDAPHEQPALQLIEPAQEPFGVSLKLPLWLHASPQFPTSGTAAPGCDTADGTQQY
jgi:hypothetical protein